MVAVLVGEFLVFVLLLGMAVYEMVCSYRNPHPVFYNSDKRLSEIYRDKGREYKTRLILKDLNYDL